jgi:hypothetical protein
VARTSLHDRLQAGNAPAPKGREALYQTPTPILEVANPDVDRQPLTVDGKPSTPTEERWEDAHTRVTFYCPVSLVKTVEAEVANSGRSKSQVIVDALQGHLRGRRTRRE